MKKNVFLLFIAATYCYSVNAQSISKFVVASGGNTISNSNHQLLFTIGEPVIGTVENEIVIGQGFLAAVQAEVTLDIDNVSELTDIVWYPNPVKNMMIIDLGQKVQKTVLHVFDQNGKEVLNQNLRRPATSINLERLASGFYIVKLTNVSKEQTKTFKIIKN